MTIERRYRCRYCGDDFPARLPVAKRPNGATPLPHLSAMHPDHVGPYLGRIHPTEDIDTVAVEAFEVIEREADGA
jgi:hypothetical protein